MPRPVNALIIDDEAHVRILLTNILKQLGIKTVWDAAEGGAGLGLVALHKPDVVILDLNLPQISGMEVLQKIKAENPKMPVIVVSAQSTIRTINKAKELGAEGFVVKYAPKAELIEMLSIALDRIAGNPGKNESGEAMKSPATT
jgi:DNA-binding NarL/FixJ family response regulator